MINKSLSLPILELKDDGVYLGGKRLDYIKTFWMNTDAEQGPITEVEITGLKSDRDGKPLIDEFGDLAEYDINQYVMVKGLDFKE